MKRFLGALGATLMLCCATMSAQLISVPYSCGFEESDSLELQNWVFNSGVQAPLCQDQWVVGEAAKNSGRRSLYISTDGGQSAEFGAKYNVVYSYRDVQLPAGNYICSFDWRCLGAAGSSLYMGIGLANSTTCNASSTSATVPAAIASWCKPATSNLFASSAWQNASMTFSANATRVYRIFFVWANANTDSTLPNPSSACIDNVQITSSNCARPTVLNVNATCDTVFLSWTGTSEQYEVDYRRCGTERWRTRNGIYAENMIIEGLDEGAYDFRVRGICNLTDTSAYIYRNSEVVFCPEKHCINYVNLTDSTTVTATTGTTTNPYANVGVVDNGANDKYSRHTVCWDADTFDPRTGGRLTTIPDGELASVRLGNWNNGAEAESLSYQYTVDASTAAILLLKYAVVLEDPGHGGTAQPRFKMEILDEYGNLIDPTCGAADFYADASREGWHAFGSGSGLVTWKDWTVIGLNLEAYDGRTLTIRLSTYDCSWSAHYGYAYFTLGCAAARISGVSCGSDATMSIEAPNGFSYQWFNKRDSMVSTSQQFAVESSDTTTYRCHLSYKEDSTCGFDLYSAVQPRFPIARFNYSYEPANCQNRVIFTNKSYVMTNFNNVEEHHYDEPCDEQDWIFGNGQNASDRNPVVIFPQEGGVFDVTLSASISEGKCVDDTTITITIPAIGNTSDTIARSLCQGDYLLFGHQIVAQTGVYRDSCISVSGCDSVTVLNLTVNPQSNLTLPDTTICYGEQLCIDGECYRNSTSGKFVRFFTNVQGCDSTVEMNVTVLDSIDVHITTSDVPGVLNSGVITITGTGYDYYTINGVRDGALTGLAGGIYDLVFYNNFGCSRAEQAVVNFECLETTIGEATAPCSGDTQLSIPLTIDKGVPTTYSLYFDANAQSKGFVDVIDATLPTTGALDVMLPATATDISGHYTATLILKDVLCEDDTIEIAFDVNYPANIIYQRWNDVLSLKNAANNGGYTFTAYQWLKNGQDMQGETKSYYFVDGGLDFSATYQMRLTRESDGVILLTCPFTPTQVTIPMSVSPTLVAAGQPVTVQTAQVAQATWFNTTGIVVDARPIQVGENSLSAPGTQGVYLLQLRFADGTQRSYHIQVTDK